MKTNICKVILLVNLLASSEAIFATGVPVADIASVKAMTETLSAAKKQYDQLRAQYDQAQKLFNASKGDRSRLFEGFKDFRIQQMLQNPTMRSYLPSETANDLLKISSNIGELRQKHNLVTPNKSSQEVFDAMLSELETMRNAYDAAGRRSKNLDTLNQRLAEANTPQEKADLLNVISLEQSNLINEKTKLDIARYNFEANREVLQAARELEFQEKYGIKK